MADYYIPLICATGNVSDFNGTPIDPVQDLLEFVDENEDLEIENEDSEEYYPDLVFRGFASAPTIELAGILMTSQILGGPHPPHRPK